MTDSRTDLLSTLRDNENIMIIIKHEAKSFLYASDCGYFAVLINK